MGLKEIRESQVLTQRQLAEKTGINRTLIARMESRPMDDVRFRNVVKLGDALEVPALRDFLNHSRVGGEHGMVSQISPEFMGSSPRRRGTLMQHVERVECAGIIPAWAGEHAAS